MELFKGVISGLVEMAVRSEANSMPSYYESGVLPVDPDAYPEPGTPLQVRPVRVDTWYLGPLSLIGRPSSVVRLPDVQHMTVGVPDETGNYHVVHDFGPVYEGNAESVNDTVTGWLLENGYTVVGE